ncbi:O-methyltransferase [Kitasatospora mediocidica]|uniref:class I SAM-dependent methyltransferase n=1 Tax=Kitasatospora mediocidica TaxID=58352 RepID=UPI00055E1DF0|nr:class I SAM-dependent methyltransferase [Kitasatospora mediocidica]
MADPAVPGAVADRARPQLTIAQTDLLAQRMVEHCVRAGVLPTAPEGLWEGYHRLRPLLYDAFEIPDTHLTPLAARLLYAVATIHRPQRVAVLGCYAGNLLGWVTAPGFGPTASYQGTHAVGLDVDADALVTAEGNLRRAGFGPAAVVVRADAYAAADFAHLGPWDLVLVDIDEPGARKAGYARLVERWAPNLAPGALVLAHDVRHPVFQWDLRDYAARLLDLGAEASTSLPVDVCGIEITRWGTAPTGARP